MNSEILFKVENLHKDFQISDKTISVLKGIDLEIKKQETLAILGASGVGKTTLLHMLGALDRPTQGEVFYNQKELYARTDKELAHFRNREIGFVFQFHYLLSDLTALENTMLPALIAKEPKKKAREKAEQLLFELGLDDRLSHRPGRLSGGEQQRVAVARAVMMDPKVILADEPTGNLDTQTASQVEELLIKLRDTRGITLVVVTHNPKFADSLDRQIYMVDGKFNGANAEQSKMA